jgi:glycosyltransferase involved in cell wall biosynthesis
MYGPPGSEQPKIVLNGHHVAAECPVGADIPTPQKDAQLVTHGVSAVRESLSSTNPGFSVDPWKLVVEKLDDLVEEMVGDIVKQPSRQTMHPMVGIREKCLPEGTTQVVAKEALEVDGLPDPSLLQELAHGQRGGVEEIRVSHGELSPRAAREVDQPSGLGVREGERLLDEDMGTSLHRGGRDGDVRVGRCRDVHDVRRIRLQEVSEVISVARDAESHRELLSHEWLTIVDRHHASQLGHLRDLADVTVGDLPTTHDRDLERHSHRSSTQRATDASLRRLDRSGRPSTLARVEHGLSTAVCYPPTAMGTGSSGHDPATARRHRVAHVVLGLGRGGLERVVVDLVNHASEAFRPVVICIEEKGPLLTAIRRGDVPVLALHRRPGFRPWLSLRVLQALRAHGADIVHTHNSAAGFYGGLAGRLGGRLVVHTKHGANLAGSRAQGLLNRLALGMTDRVVAVSQATRALALSEGAGDRDTCIIDNGIDLARFVRRPGDRERARALFDIPHTAFVVGSVARLAPEKNHALLVEAFCDVGAHEGPLALVLVGDGPEEEALRQRAGARRGCGRIVFAGARERVEEVLPAFDVFALCSDSEGLPVALLEAMAAGVAPVVTRVGAMPDAVGGGDAGLVVPRGGRAELTQALDALQRNPQRCATLGQAAREGVRARYSASRMAREYEALYAQLAQTAHGQR